MWNHIYKHWLQSEEIIKIGTLIKLKSYEIGGIFFYETPDVFIITGNKWDVTASIFSAFVRRKRKHEMERVQLSLHGDGVLQQLVSKIASIDEHIKGRLHRLQQTECTVFVLDKARRSKVKSSLFNYKAYWFLRYRSGHILCGLDFSSVSRGW